MHDKPIIVAGAGIGGLATAVALAKRGFRVRVIERVAALQPVGAGIGLAPNAVALLDHWGLREALEVGSPLSTMAVATAAGAPLSEVAIEHTIGGKKVRQLGIHRAALIEALLSHAQGTGQVEIEFGDGVAGFKDCSSHVQVRLSSGRLVDAPALVAADGIHSGIRAQLHGESEPRYAGYTCWRGVTAAGQATDGRGMELWGKGRRFGFLPIGGGRVYWFAVQNAAPGSRVVGEAARGMLMEHFADAFEFGRVRELIRSTAAQDIVHNDIVDRAPVNRWGRGRVTLLGDAAHAMTPNLGQGACQAIEDAAVLAQALACDEGVEPALRAYEAQRIPRVNALVRRSAWMGKVGQLENGPLSALRNWAVRRVSAEAMQAQLERDLSLVVAPMLAQEAGLQL